MREHNRKLASWRLPIRHDGQIPVWITSPGDAEAQGAHECRLHYNLGDL